MVRVGPEADRAAEPGRPTGGVDHPEHAAVDGEDERATHLHDVGLVDTGFLVVRTGVVAAGLRQRAAG